MKDENMKSGIYKGISNEDYHGGDGISKSGLDKIHKSALHYKHSQEDDFTQTPAMKIGSLAHALILEPENFWELYARPFVATDDMIKTMDDMKKKIKEIEESQ